MTQLLISITGSTFTNRGTGICLSLDSNIPDLIGQNVAATLGKHHVTTFHRAARRALKTSVERLRLGRTFGTRRTSAGLQTSHVSHNQTPVPKWSTQSHTRVLIVAHGRQCSANVLPTSLHEWVHLLQEVRAQWVWKSKDAMDTAAWLATSIFPQALDAPPIPSMTLSCCATLLSTLQLASPQHINTVAVYSGCNTNRSRAATKFQHD